MHHCPWVPDKSAAHHLYLSFHVRLPTEPGPPGGTEPVCLVLLRGDGGASKEDLCTGMTPANHWDGYNTNSIRAHII